MQDPKVHFVPSRPILSMIHKYNIAELSLVDRPVQGTKSGFGSTLPRHNNQHEKRYWETEHRTFYGQPDSSFNSNTLTQTRKAGTNVRPFEL